MEEDYKYVTDDTFLRANKKVVIEKPLFTEIGCC